MARDLMDLGVRVNSIMPGIFATPPMPAVKDKAPAISEGLAASVPFPKRLGKPEEFGSLVRELPRNKYITDHNHRLHGPPRIPPKPDYQYTRTPTQPLPPTVRMPRPHA